jgi:hypothetical protein
VEETRFAKQPLECAPRQSPSGLLCRESLLRWSVSLKWVVNHECWRLLQIFKITKTKPMAPPWIQTERPKYSLKRVRSTRVQWSAHCAPQIRIIVSSVSEVGRGNPIPPHHPRPEIRAVGPAPRPSTRILPTRLRWGGRGRSCWAASSPNSTLTAHHTRNSTSSTYYFHYYVILPCPTCRWHRIQTARPR